MPDWFYRTVAQPALFLLDDARARALALGVIGPLGRSRAGRAVIDLLGHMRADAAHAGVKHGVRFHGRVGVGCWIDPEGRATGGLGRFGVGFIEVGPISSAGGERASPCRDDLARGLVLAGTEGGRDAASWQIRLALLPPDGPPVWARLSARRDLPPAEAIADLQVIAARLRERADVFVIENAPPGLAFPAGWRWLHAAAAGARPSDLPVGHSAGVVIGAQKHEDGTTLIAANLDDAMLASVRQWRDALGPDAVIVHESGFSNPQEAQRLLAAGADLLKADAGLVYTGPGLVKRINTSLPTAVAERGPSTPPDTPLTAPRTAWFWGTVLGTAMMAGGALTGVIAVTRVLLPYDEHFLGVSAAMLARLQPRLFAFMEHDRLTLAGTMLACGAVYIGLAQGGLRAGRRWPGVALTSSALTGFLSFFLFLGFGYFDGLHAFVSAVLLQFTLLALSGQRVVPMPRSGAPADLVNDGAWRRSLWAQLLLVVHAVGLLGAGLVISGIAITHVFVREDLNFLCATPGELTAFNERIVAVVAHDRAALGGMLLAIGIASLLATLWGFRRGERWLWWSLLAMGGLAYPLAIGTHLHVGYVDPWHLAPAFIGAGLWAAALLLARDYLLERMNRPVGPISTPGRAVHCSSTT